MERSLHGWADDARPRSRSIRLEPGASPARRRPCRASAWPDSPMCRCFQPWWQPAGSAEPRAGFSERSNLAGYLSACSAAERWRSASGRRGRSMSAWGWRRSPSRPAPGTEASPGSRSGARSPDLAGGLPHGARRARGPGRGRARTARRGRRHRHHGRRRRRHRRLADRACSPARGRADGLARPRGPRARPVGLCAPALAANPGLGPRSRRAAAERQALSSSPTDCRGPAWCRT